MDQILRDQSGKKIGTIETRGDVQTLRDASGRKCGTYEVKNNVTRDAAGRKIGTGNLLVTLLPR